MLGWFKKTSPNSVAKRSEAIIGVFSKTKDQCEKLTQEIDTASTDKKTKIQKMEEEINQMNAVKEKSQRLVGKINSFIND